MAKKPIKKEVKPKQQVKSSSKTDITVAVDKKILTKFEELCKKNALYRDQLLENMMKEFIEKIEIYNKQMELSKKIMKEQVNMNEKALKQYESEIKKGNIPKNPEDLKNSPQEEEDEEETTYTG